MISEAIRFIFKQQTPFWTGRVMDVIFDGNLRQRQKQYFSLSYFLHISDTTGIPIDCTSKNFKARTICSLFENGESEFIQQVTDDATEFRFSLLAHVSVPIINRI